MFFFSFYLPPSLLFFSSSFSGHGPEISHCVVNFLTLLGKLKKYIFSGVQLSSGRALVHIIFLIHHLRKQGFLLPFCVHNYFKEIIFTNIQSNPNCLNDCVTLGNFCGPLQTLVSIYLILGK